MTKVFEFFFDGDNQPLLRSGIDFLDKGPVNRAIRSGGANKVFAAIRIIDDVIIVFFSDLLHGVPAQRDRGLF